MYGDDLVVDVERNVDGNANSAVDGTGHSDVDVDVDIDFDVDDVRFHVHAHVHVVLLVHVVHHVFLLQSDDQAAVAQFCLFRLFVVFLFQLLASVPVLVVFFQFQIKNVSTNKIGGGQYVKINVQSLYLHLTQYFSGWVAFRFPQVGSFKAVGFKTSRKNVNRQTGDPSTDSKQCKFIR